MTKTRPYVLSIAGLDPSGGAGILADIKTFEQHKVSGMGIVTGLTFQNDSEFNGVKWIEIAEIKKQIEILRNKYKFDFVKIGMIKDWDTLHEIISSCQLPPDSHRGANCRLIWDPILKASAGFEIHKTIDKKKIIEICKKMYLITPNVEEIRILTGEVDEHTGAKELSIYCNVLLKGGHSEKKRGYDHLFTTEGKMFSFRPRELSPSEKHGSGCVLSSSITANLANGLSLQRSCLKGKDYVTKFLLSNKSLLGYHKI